MKNKKLVYSIVAIVVVILTLIVLDQTLDAYKLRIVNLCAIYIILAVSMNLINGFTGLFLWDMQDSWPWVPIRQQSSP